MHRTVPLIPPGAIPYPRVPEAVLKRGAKKPPRLEMLIELGRAYLHMDSVEACHKAYPCYLEALGLAGDSVQQLWCLHDLAHLEWALASTSRDDPPFFSLYFNLASHHLRRAGEHYSLDPPLAHKASHLRNILLLESTTWLMGSGLRTELRRLREADSREPLKELELLIFAVSNGDGRFKEDHYPEIRDQLTESGPTRARLAGIRDKVENLYQRLDERAQKLAVSPWLEAVELVLPQPVSA